MMAGQGRRLVAALLLAALTGCGGDATGGPQTSTPSATPSSALGTIPAGTAPIEPGTYRVPSSAWSVVDYTVTFPEGWTVHDGGSYRKHADPSDGLSLEAFVPDTFYADACEGSASEHIEVGFGVEDLATALLEQQGPKASGPVETTLGGYPATRIDLTVPNGFDLKPCSLPDGLQIWFSHPSDGYFVLFPESDASVYIVDVEGQRQVFQTQYGSAASTRTCGSSRRSSTRSRSRRRPDAAFGWYLRVSST